MNRAYLIEMSIFRNYAIYLLGIGVFLTILLGVSMKTVFIAPAVLTCMYFTMGSMSAAAYDEKNGWEMYRLTLPLSKHDVVFGRYAAIVTLGLIGGAVGLLVSSAAMGVSALIDLPKDLADAFTFSSDSIQGMALAFALSAFLGSAISAFVTPVYFKFGQTKATQILPTAIIILIVVPFVLISNSETLQNALQSQFMERIISVLDGPFGLAVALATLIVTSALMLTISARVSLRIYSQREL